MKKTRAARVPVLENAFEINLPKLMRTAKLTGDSRVVLDDGDMRTVVMLTQTRLAVLLGDRPWVVDIVAVQCLKGRSRHLLRCPRAHEGNFQSLYYRGNELACRHCHELRYRTNVAANKLHRTRIKQRKLLSKLGGQPGDVLPARQPGRWRKLYETQAHIYSSLSSIHYDAVKNLLKKWSNLSIHHNSAAVDAGAHEYD